MSRVLRRRQFLIAGGSLFGISLLAACAATPATPTTAPAAPTTAPAAPTTAPAAPTTAPAAPTAATAATPAAQATKPAAVATTAPAPTTAAAATPATAAKPTGEAVTLRFNCRSGTEETCFRQIADGFVKTNPNVTVTFEPSAGAGYGEKITVLVAGGTEGDLWWASFQEQFVDHAARGSLLPIDDLVSRDKVDMAQWYKPAVEMLRIKNRLYGLPVWSHSSLTGLFYNADLFAKEGLAAPNADWTTNNLTEAAIKLTKRVGSTVQQLGVWPGRNFFFGLEEPIIAHGGKPLSDDRTKMTLNEPGAKAGLQYMADLFQKHKVAPVPGADLNVGNLMISQKLAMQINGYWGKAGAVAAWKDFKWSIAPTPKGPAGTNGPFLHTDPVPISKRTKFADQAWLLEQALASKDAGMILYQNSYIPGSRPDVWSDPKLMADPNHAVWVPLMEKAGNLIYPANFRLTEFSKTIESTMDKVWVGQATLDEGIAEAMRVGQGILDQPPPA